MSARLLVPVLSIALTFLPASAFAQVRRGVAVPPAIVDQLRREPAPAEWVELWRDSLATNLAAEPLDLNGDGIPELQVHGINAICGANNCVTWIYRRTASGYERLLVAGPISSVEPQRTVSHGYRDLITAMHGSAWDADLTLYKFDGRTYVRAGCFSRTYHYLDTHDQVHELKRPRIMPRACVPDE